MLSRFEILAMDEATAGQYARITAKLRRENQLIGTNDLWIAAAAMAHGLELVTNNTAHFGRVAGLSLRGY
jgi:predicted nucleic acid-binding protein